MALSSVLLVDDSDADNLIHRINLVRAGVVASEAAVVVARDGAEALELLTGSNRWPARRLFPPAAILVDVNMPLMGGFEFVRRLQPFLTGALGTTRIFMLSSSVAARDLRSADDLAVIAGYIAKPLTRARARELGERLER